MSSSALIIAVFALLAFKFSVAKSSCLEFGNFAFASKFITLIWVLTSVLVLLMSLGLTPLQFATWFGIGLGLLGFGIERFHT